MRALIFKPIYLLIFVSLFLMVSQIKAQVNIAPLAIASASTCNTGPCSALNNLIYGTCSNQEMWISTATPPNGTEWLEFTWTTPQTMDKITIHHAQTTGRFLAGGTIQKWDGSAYVNHFTFSGLNQSNCINDVNFPVMTSTRFRITAFVMGAVGQQSNVNFREIEIWRAASSNNDVGVLSIDSPSIYTAGLNNVVASIKNFGRNRINTVNVGWSINGVTQTPVTITTLIDTLGGVGPNQIQANIGTINLANNVTYKVRAWTYLPNGNADTILTNDTCSNYYIRSPLAGTYTIGMVGADFVSMTEAAAILGTAGVSAPVTFQLIDFLYSTSTGETFPVTFTKYPGASPNRPVIIRPSASSNPLIIDSISRPLFVFSGVKYISLEGRRGVNDTTRNITIENRSINASARLISYINDANSCTLRNCILRSANPNTASTATSIYIGGTTNPIPLGNDSLRITSNLFGRSNNLPFANGIFSEGQSVIAQNNHITIDSNWFQGFSFTAIGVPATATGNGGNFRIIGNSFYDTAITATTNTLTCISFIPGISALSDNNLISGNMIGGNGPMIAGGTSSKWTFGTLANISMNGIVVNSGTNGGTRVTKNIIRNIAMENPTGSYSLNGIQVTGGDAVVGGSVADANHFGHPSEAHNIYSRTASGVTTGFVLSTNNTGTLTHNYVQNITHWTTGSNTMRGINAASSTNATIVIDSNVIRALSSGTTSASVTTSTPLVGIQSSSSGPSISISNNFIGGDGPTDSLVLRLGSTGRMAGILFSSGNNTIQNNSIKGLYSYSTATGTTTSSVIMGIAKVGTVNGQLVNNNTIGNINQYNAASSSVSGIFIAGGVTEVRGNSISGIFTNSSNTGATNGSSLAGIMVSSSLGGDMQVTGNTIQNLTNINNSGNQINGIVVANTLGNNVSNNLIRNLRGNGLSTGGSVVGINMQTNAINQMANNNSIYNLTSTNPAGTPITIGIIFTGSNTVVGNNSTVSNNTIHSFGIEFSTNNNNMQGIQIAGNALVSNNMIRLGLDTAGLYITRPILLRPIIINSSGAAQVRVYHNSVYAESKPFFGVGSTTLYSAALEVINTISAPGFVDIRNNILVNRSTDTSTATLEHYVVKLPASLLNIRSDFNILYNTDSVQSNVYRVGITNYKYLSNAKSSLFMEGSSGFGNPQFINPTGNFNTVDLRLQNNNPAEGAGDTSILSFVNSDIDGNLRSINSPVDIGAKGGIYSLSADLNAPAITYSPFTQTAILTNRTLIANIFDGGGLSPIRDTARVFYRKNLAGSWVNTLGTLSSGNYKNGNWIFTIDNSILGGVFPGDTIYYFVAAQDSAGNFNSNGMYSPGPINNLTVFPNPPQLLTYRVISQFGTNITIGTGGNFPTLTGAGGLFEAINNSVLQGNTEVTILNNITEPGTFALNNWLESGTGTYTLTIRPANNTQVEVSGSIANTQGLIRFNGTSRIKMLGWSPTGFAGDTNLIIRASAASTPAIGLINGAALDTFQNVIFESRSATTTNGAIYLLASNTMGVNGILFNGCHIRLDITSTSRTLANAVFGQGVLPNFVSNIRLTNNHFYNFNGNGIISNTATGGNWVISGNHFYQTAFLPVTTAITVIGFQPGNSSDNNQITNNWIGGTAPYAGGSPLTTNSTFVGMTINTGSVAGTLIQNNVIDNLTLNAASTGLTGIFVTGTPGNYVVHGNRIGSLSGNSISIAGNGRVQGINSGTSGNITITRDSIINILHVSAGTSAGITGINVSGGTGNTNLIQNNFIKGLVLTSCTNTGTNTAAAIQGITMQSGSLNQNILNNDLKTFVINGSSSYQLIGILVTGGVSNVNNNSLYGFSSSSSSVSTAGTATPIIGIARFSTVAGNQITSDNILDSFAYASATPIANQMVGIMQTSVSAEMKRNLIHDFYSQSTNINTGASSAILGMMYTGGNVNNLIEKNKIYAFLHSNAMNSTPTLTGIQYSGSTAIVGNYSSVSSNLIHSFYSNSTNIVGFTGIVNTSGLITCANNMIRLGYDTIGAVNMLPRNIRGIHHNHTVQSQYYHNSVLINSSPIVGSGNTSAMEFSSTIAVGQLIDLRNNILVNLSTNSALATGKNWCIKLVDSLRIISNYNLYYHSTTTGVNAFLGGSNLLDYPTLSGAGGWKAITNLDMASGYGDPLFTAAAIGSAAGFDLSLLPSNPAEKSGDPTLTSVSLDYFGSNRGLFSGPDIGAHAGNFNLSSDVFPPVISYIPLGNSGTLSGTRTLSGVTISDNNSVPSSGTNQPRIYYSKDGITWYNSSATSITGTSTNINASFSIDYTPLLPLTVADTIKYYVIAQDNSGNTISNAPFAIASSVSSILSHPVNPGKYTFLPIIPANSSFQVGTGQTYTSLTGPGGFFEFVNGRTLGGNITAFITSSINIETGQNMLNAFAEDGAGSYTLTIRPATGTNSVLVLQGSPANTQNTTGSLVILNGASRVKLLGYPIGGNASNRLLRIVNNNTAGSSFEMRNGASANLVNGCILEAGTNVATIGAVSFLVTAGNTLSCNQDTIMNCLVRNNNNATLPAGISTFGIYSNGQVGVFNQNNVVINNEIINFGNSGMVLDLNNGNGWVFTGNSFYNNLPYSINTTQFVALNIVPNQNGSGYLIANNYIGGTAANCGGTPWVHNGSTNFFGIRTSTGINSDVLIQNNTIQNINFNVPSTSTFNGIAALGGSTVIGGSPALGNLIGSTTNVNSIVFGNFGLNTPISYSGTNSINITGNVMCGIQSGVTGQSASFNGINISSGTVTACNQNMVGSTTLANSIQCYGTGQVNGINVSVPANLSPTFPVNGNTIANIYASGTQASVGVSGIRLNANSGEPITTNNLIFNLSTNSSNITFTNNTAMMGINIVTATNAQPVVSGNTIYGLRCLNSGQVNTNVTGILLQQAKNPIINANRIYDLTNASTSLSSNPTPTAVGIAMGNTSNIGIQVTNNQITLGLGSNNNTQFIGIWQGFSSTAITTQIINNSVLISGVAASGNMNTYALLRGNNSGSEMNTLMNVRNNVFANIRTGGTGNHFAIANQASSPTNNTWFSSSSNHNLFVTANSANMGQWGLNAQTYGSWITNSTGDALSYYAQSTAGTSTGSQINLSNLFVNPAVGNLGLQTANAEVWYVYGKGISGSISSGLTSDYAGTSRPSITGMPGTIGSIQMNAIPVSLPIAAIASASPSANSSTTFSFGSRMVGVLNWGASAPTSASLLDFTGVNPIGATPAGNNMNRYFRVNISGGTAPYSYGANFNYDPANMGLINSAVNLKLSKESGGTMVSPTWLNQSTSTVNTTAGTFGATAMTSTTGFTALFFTGNENNVAPSVISFTPPAGAIGAAVTIRGTLFTGATALLFNGVSQPVFTVVNDTTITTTVPIGATTGPVSVTNTYGTGVSSINFEVIPNPVIISFTPGSGTFGTIVTINGSGFNWATQVKFNLVNASSFVIVNNTTITAVVPGTATTGPISVTSSGGVANSASNFIVIGTPTVTSFTPASGPIGTSVTVNGTNFDALTQVRFNGVSASYSVGGPTQLTATVPAGASTGVISVQNGSGTGNSSTNFVVTFPPVINNFTPTAGGVGTLVTITGSNFTGATSLTFNGVPAVGFTVVNSTTITANVPATATTGSIGVVTPAGTGVSNSQFTVYTDLIVNTVQTVSGTYNNITVTSTGDANLTGNLVAIGNTQIQSGGIVRFGNNSLSGNGNLTVQSGTKLYIGSPFGIGSTGILNGNVAVNGTRTYASAASYIYDGTSPQITGSGLPASVDTLIVANLNGVSLTQSVIVNRLALGNGNINIGDQNLTVNGSIINASATGFVVTSNNPNALGSLIRPVTNNTVAVQFPVGNSTTYNPVNLSLTASSVADSYRVRAIPGVFENGLSGNAITSDAVNKSWIINENVTGGSNLTVQVEWFDTLELAGFARGNSRLAYYNTLSPGWSFFSLTAAAGVNPYTLSQSGITVLGTFTVVDTGSTLPVELISFAGKYLDQKVYLNWTTSSEINNSHFEIERSLNGTDFEYLGKVDGSGNSQIMHAYQLLDENLPEASVIYYRLKQVDFDGKSEYLGVVSIQLNTETSNLNWTTYPNPFENNLQIDVFAPSEGTGKLSLTTMTGELIFMKETQLEKGMNNLKIEDLSLLKEGVYILRLDTESESLHLKLIKNGN